MDGPVVYEGRDTEGRDGRSGGVGSGTLCHGSELPEQVSGYGSVPLTTGPTYPVIVTWC
jgi:hypothetical protein